MIFLRLNNFKFSKSIVALTSYTSSSLLRNIVALIIGIVILRWVSPLQLGIWGTLLLAQPYLQFLNLGIHIGINRELPYSLGKKDIDSAQKIIDTGYFVSLVASFASLVFFSAYVLYLFFIKDDLSYLWTGISVGVIIFITFLQLFITSIFRTNDDFRKLSKLYLLESLFMVLLVPIVYLYHYKGFLIYQLSYRIGLLLLTILYKPYNIHPIYNKSTFKLLIKIGAPLYLFGYINNIIKTIPRLIILTTGGVVMLGLYSPVNTISNSLHLTSKYFAQFFSPKMAFQIGQNKSNTEKLWRYTIKSTIVVFFANILLIMPAYILIEVLVPIVIPLYVESITAMQIILFTGVLSGASVGIVALNSIKDIKGRFFLTMSNFIIVTGSVLLFFFLIKDKLIAVAIGLVSADLFQNVFVLFFVKKRLEEYEK